MDWGTNWIFRISKVKEYLGKLHKSAWYDAAKETFKNIRQWRQQGNKEELDAHEGRSSQLVTSASEVGF